jgi:isochorismate synthase
VYHVEKAINHISEGLFDKLVLSRVKLLENYFDSTWQIFNNLKFSYPEAFVYALYHRKYGIWMGASPELLLQSKKDLYETVALAGTRPFANLTFAEMWGKKELDEHSWLELYLDKVSRDNNLDYSKSEKYTQKAGGLAHIRSDYKFQTEMDFLSMAELLHPGPAISGYPTESAVHWLTQFEGYNRSLYTGYLGPIHFNGHNAVYTNIRCMQLFRDKCALYLGAGITKDSNPKDEYLETEQKAKTLSRFLKKPEMA